MIKNIVKQFRCSEEFSLMMQRRLKDINIDRLESGKKPIGEATYIRYLINEDCNSD